MFRNSFFFGIWMHKNWLICQEIKREKNKTKIFWAYQMILCIHHYHLCFVVEQLKVDFLNCFAMCCQTDAHSLALTSIRVTLQRTTFTMRWTKINPIISCYYRWQYIATERAYAFRIEIFLFLSPLYRIHIISLHLQKYRRRIMDKWHTCAL